MRAKQLQQGILVGLLLLIIFWLVSLIMGLAGKAQIAVKEARDAQSQYEALEKRKNTLQANLEALETPLGQEAAVRAAFGVARPGEEVIVVVPPAVATSTPEPTVWQKILNWF